MPDSPTVIEAARQLGRLLAQHPAVQKLESLMQQLDEDREARRLQTDLTRHRETLAEKQREGKPIEVDDKRRLETLQQSVAAHPLLRDLQMAQMDYLDLMRQVDQQISAARSEADPPASDG